MSSSESEIWPKGMKADPLKLVEAVEELSAECPDPKIKQQVAEATGQLREVERIVKSPAPEILLRDLPESCLDGRLGEICVRRLSDLPRSYSWTALVVTASALIDRRAPGVRTNLFGAVVGGVHTGKSQAIERAQKVVGLESPVLLECMSGSAEQLIRKVKDAAGNPRLFSPDELGHTLEKMRIERSSFSFVLNSAYYKDRFEVLLGRRESAVFDCHLSILGGLVEDRFSDLFNAATTGGLYDRFLFGLCPGGFTYDYFPFEGGPELVQPVCVQIDCEVWELKSALLKEFPKFTARVVENGIRCATICAAFDGKHTLRAADLDPHIELIRYQSRIRELLKPNPGETIEGRAAHKILSFLESLGGRFVSQRELIRETHLYRLGPTCADRALSVLQGNGDIEIVKSGRTRLVRLVRPEEEIESEGPPQ
jgi:hypothetical protein